MIETCQDCKHYRDTYMSRLYPDMGECLSSKFVPEEINSNIDCNIIDGVYATGEIVRIFVGKQFGCIHFEATR